MLNLLIADDHTLVREGLKRILALANDMAVAGEAANGRELLNLMRQGEFDIVLLDLTMPDYAGTDLISRLHARHALLPILVLSMHNDPQVVAQALKAGASGYLTKDSDPETLLAAVRKVAAGGRFIEPALAEKMVFVTCRTGERPPHESLTQRELQVFRLLVLGKGINEISRELCLSCKTVSTHKTRLMQKMNLHNSVGLIRYAMAHGLDD